MVEVGVTVGLSARVVVNRSGAFTLDISLTIAPGETVALLGPNGAGKSTAVAAIAGLIPIDRGRITLDGRVLDDPTEAAYVPPEDRRVGVVFQGDLLFPHLSVCENIAFGLRSRGVRRGEARAIASEWSERMGLAGLAGRRPRRLSGGQAQRVALARALASDPELMLLDEPLSALDVSTRAGLRRVLADHLARFRGPRLLITHDPTEAFLLADTIHVIENGAITQVGTADEIRLRPRTPYIADLAGANLFRGTAAAGDLEIDGHHLSTGDTSVSGKVLATIHPRAVALFPTRPEGSPRNTWKASIERIEPLGDRVRVRVGHPLPMTAEVTAGAAEALHLEPGSPVWVTVKAAEIGLEPNGGGAGRPTNP